MGQFLTFTDLTALASTLTEGAAAIIIDDLEAQAVEEAACITDPAFPYADQVRGILRQAALRWHRAGEGGIATQSLSSGPFGMTTGLDTRSTGEGRLYPSEVRRLQRLCRRWKEGDGPRRKAFTIMPGGRP